MVTNDAEDLAGGSTVAGSPILPQQMRQRLIGRM